MYFSDCTGAGMVRAENERRARPDPRPAPRCHPRRATVDAADRRAAGAFPVCRGLLPDTLGLAAHCPDARGSAGAHAREPLRGSRQDAFGSPAANLRGAAGLRHGSAGGAQGRCERRGFCGVDHRRDPGVGLVAGPGAGHRAENQRAHLGGHGDLRRVGHRGGRQRHRGGGRRDHRGDGDGVHPQRGGVVPFPGAGDTRCT